MKTSNMHQTSHRVRTTRRLTHVKTLRAKESHRERRRAQTSMQGVCMNAHKNGNGKGLAVMAAAGTALLAAKTASAENQEKTVECVGVKPDEYNFNVDVIAPLVATGVEFALLLAVLRKGPIMPKKLFRKDPDGKIIVYPINRFPIRKNAKGKRHQMSDEIWMDLMDELKGRRDTPVNYYPFKLKVDLGEGGVGYELIKRNVDPKKMSKKKNRNSVIAAAVLTSVLTAFGVAAVLSPEPKKEPVAEVEENEPKEANENEIMWLVPFVGFFACLGGAIPLFWRREKEGMAIAKAEFLKQEEAKGKRN